MVNVACPKKLSLILPLVFLSGCAGLTLGHDFDAYQRTYRRALEKKENFSLIKRGEFEAIKGNTLKYLEGLGYTKSVYLDPEEGFLVFAKDGPVVNMLSVHDFYRRQIIVKFSRQEPDKYRIDLIRASHNPMTNKEVDQDVVDLYELLQEGNKY